MKLKHSTHAAAASVVALSLSLLASLSAQQSRLEVAAAVGARSDNPPAEVQDEAARQTAEKRREIIQDAVDALRETQNALKALEQNRNPDAIRALANATGKLELVLARDPRLALAPVDVGFRIVDVYTSPDTVRETVRRAEDFLEDGMVQNARSLISDLASELVVSVENLPLATYPDAIKAVTPMIDAGKIAEAKKALQVALGTLVVVETIAAADACGDPARGRRDAGREDRSDRRREQAPCGAFVRGASAARARRSTRVWRQKCVRGFL